MGAAGGIRATRRPTGRKKQLLDSRFTHDLRPSPGFGAAPRHAAVPYAIMTCPTHRSNPTEVAAIIEVLTSPDLPAAFAPLAAFAPPTAHAALTAFAAPSSG